MNGAADRSSAGQYDPTMRPRPQRLDRLPPQYFVGLLGRVASAAALGVWVKAIHHDEGWTVAPGELSSVSDAGIINRHGDRMYRDDGQPAGEPSWRVGDPIGLYFASTKRIPYS